MKRDTAIKILDYVAWWVAFLCTLMCAFGLTMIDNTPVIEPTPPEAKAIVVIYLTSIMYILMRFEQTL